MRDCDVLCTCELRFDHTNEVARRNIEIPHVQIKKSSNTKFATTLKYVPTKKTVQINSLSSIQQ